MEDCIFCKIVTDQIPSFKIFENDKYLAFLDIKPMNPGHTLLIPKDHHRWVYDVPNTAQYWQIANEIALKIKNSLNSDYISFITAGMEVPHAHIHIIPRFTDDHMSDMFDSLRLNTSIDEVEKVYNQINKL